MKENSMISPEEFARALGLTVISGTRRQHGMRIRVADLCRPGLQFAGYFDVFASERPQLIGKTEMAYLNSLPPEVRDERLDRYFSYEIPCIVIARGMPCPPALLQQAVRHGVPIYGTLYETSAFTGMAIGYLSEALAPRQTCHGVLLDVFGVGVLITGESGIGKSECALELIKRGHQLVADDVVDISRVGSKLVGESPEMVRDFMELRGIGIVDIKSIFGIGAVLRRKTINIVIHLEIWSPDKDYDRLGTREQTTEILGVNLPLIEMPVRSGRNLAIIMEIAARNWRLKSEGYNAVAELDRRLAQRFSAQRDEEEE
ncbi:MAG: HPr(Ser) kinase/phosphatase [Candidatus Ventricola sp.]|nr:HPr(Ser) kinase/phosphatase [Candidatus Ventricola sp.]